MRWPDSLELWDGLDGLGAGSVYHRDTLTAVNAKKRNSTNEEFRLATIVHKKLDIL